jgi:hypothetical protein
MLGSRNAARRHAATLLGIGLFLVTSLPARAAVPAGPAERAQAIGQPAALLLQPASITLSGPRAMQQLVVSGRYADGTVRDLTPLCDFSSDTPGIVAVGADGFLTPLKNGAAGVIVKVGGQTGRVAVVVNNLQTPQPVSFRHDMIAALSVGGCNQGACHGTPSGKNGFKLSLRGYDPAADYLQLTRDVLGRRTDRLGPQSSLILLKALAKVPHEGGLRFRPNSVPAQVFRAWLSEGLQDDPANLPALKRIEVLPGSRVLNSPDRWQQLAVIAHFANGQARDVTRLTVFSSSDPGIAGVSTTGLVEFEQPGEVAILCRYLDELTPVRLTYLEPKKGFAWPNPPQANFIDHDVFAKLKMLSIPPSGLCSDEEFVRRAYMDICGILPRADQTRAFLASKDPARRARLIDTLLERPEFADFWTLKWSDVLRSSRKSIQLKGAYSFQKWLHSHISRNTPLDQVVRELLTATGDTFANPPANYYRISRDPTSLAETTAQLFFGVRMQCAKCHNHPFEKWTQDDYYSMAAFFARVKERKDPADPTGAKKDGSEYVYLDRAGEVVQPRSGKVMPPRFLGGMVPKVGPSADRRAILARWLTSADNPFFAKSVVNRIWYHLMGRGIVDPVDDFRDSNPSANDDLLDALAQDFVAHHFDAKHLIRTICSSRTYQLSAQTNELNKDDNKYFSHAVTKLYTAEQLFDALCQVTDVPERFPGVPLGTRAVQLPDGEVNNPFLKTFGQPARELACECEREGDSNLAQALQLINGPAVNDRLRNPGNRIGKLLAKNLPDREVLNELYLATLARLPAESEAQVTLAHVRGALPVLGASAVGLMGSSLGQGPVIAATALNPERASSLDKRRAWEDVQWALINAKEFLFRH